MTDRQAFSELILERGSCQFDNLSKLFQRACISSVDSRPNLPFARNRILCVRHGHSGLNKERGSACWTPTKTLETVKKHFLARINVVPDNVRSQLKPTHWNSLSSLLNHWRSIIITNSQFGTPSPLLRIARQIHYHKLRSVVTLEFD